MAAVAAFALGSGGFTTALLAFLVFALTMGSFVFLIAILGAASGPALAKSLRRWGRYVQRASGLILILVGAALVFASANPGFFDRLILK